jgi:membrane dipeptidase
MTGVIADPARLHADALVWDNHSCPPVERTEDFLPAALGRYRKAGVDVLGVNAADSNIDLETLVRIAAKIRWFVAQNPDKYLMVRDAEDVRRAKRDGRMAVLLNIEGCYAMGDQLSLVQFFFDIGVRWMAMVYNRRNLVGSGVHDETDEGLTPFGRQVVAEMDRVGMLKCCSHTGYRTAMDVLEATSRPTIFSHSNPKALRDHPRNIPDELIKACAATGGVIGLNGVGIFLGDNDVRTETLVRHVEYLAELVGPQHVGLGLDAVFDQASLDASLSGNSHLWPPEFGYRPGISFYQPDQLPELTAALAARGWSEADIRGVLGENLLRVAAEIWPSASDTR